MSYEADAYFLTKIAACKNGISQTQLVGDVYLNGFKPRFKRYRKQKWIRIVFTYPNSAIVYLTPAGKAYLRNIARWSTP